MAPSCSLMKKSSTSAALSPSSSDFTVIDPSIKSYALSSTVRLKPPTRSFGLKIKFEASIDLTTFTSLSILTAISVS